MQLSSRLGTVCALIAAIAVTIPSRASAQNLQPLSVIVFPGGFNWPIWAAQEQGYFARGGIEVKLTNTPNSVFQLTNLIEGKFDIAISTKSSPMWKARARCRSRPRPTSSRSWAAITAC